MRFSRSLVAATLVAMTTSGAGAQVVARQFLVTPRGGYVTFDRASSIQGSGFVGLDAQYNITRMFAVGLTFLTSRPSTRGEDFVAALSFGDTTFLFEVQQPLTVVDVGLAATARLPMAGRFSPFLTGGVGAYTLYFDPQVVAGERRFQRMSATVGGGVNVQLGRQSGIQLDVRDMMFMNYDRSRLNPTQERFANTRFIEDFPRPPSSKDLVHNIVFSIGFSFTPNVGAGDDDETEVTGQ